MHIVTNIAEMRRLVKSWRREYPDASIGLVPTMGALHAGHIALVRTARAHCHRVVASLFVNPLQFAANEDFARYPRTFAADCAHFEQEGVDAVFAPSAQEMYPAGAETLVEVPHIGARLDGASRPGHFRGVATVVAKLFHIVAPDRAFFGQKDAAQVAVLQAMVRDLNFDLELIVVPTLRDTDGVALSSRNAYLTPQERQRARALSQALSHVEHAIAAGERNAEALRASLQAQLAGSEGVRVDYADLVDPDTLNPVEDVRSGALIAVAAWIGDTRLIDNILIAPQENP